MKNSILDKETLLDLLEELLVVSEKFKAQMNDNDLRLWQNISHFVASHFVASELIKGKDH